MALRNKDFYKQTFLVTGASGFIGTALVSHLLQQGSEVHALSRSMQYRRDSSLKWWQGNCTDYTFMRHVIEACKPEVVFHLAGYVYGTQALSSVIPSYHGNLTSTVNLLTILAEVGCKKVVLAGSLEEPDENVPSSPYAASKWACEGYARMFHTLYHVPVVNTRIFMVYGHGQKETKKLIPYLILSYLKSEQPKISSGNRLIDWIYIDDVVEGLIATAENANINGQRLDIGSGKQISVRQLAELLYELTHPLSYKPLFGKVPERQLEQVKMADAEATERKINWKPMISMKEGLMRTIEWYKNNTT